MVVSRFQQKIAGWRLQLCFIDEQTKLILQLNNKQPTIPCTWPDKMFLRPKTELGKPVTLHLTLMHAGMQDNPLPETEWTPSIHLLASILFPKKKRENARWRILKLYNRWEMWLVKLGMGSDFFRSILAMAAQMAAAGFVQNSGFLWPLIKKWPHFWVLWKKKGKILYG